MGKFNLFNLNKAGHKDSLEKAILYQIFTEIFDDSESDDDFEDLDF